MGTGVGIHRTTDLILTFRILKLGMLVLYVGWGLWIGDIMYDYQDQGTLFDVLKGSVEINAHLFLNKNVEHSKRTRSMPLRLLSHVCHMS